MNLIKSFPIFNQGLYKGGLIIKENHSRQSHLGKVAERTIGYEKVDKSGNYSFGIKEHIIFPEVNFDKVDKIRGLDITIVTSSKTKQGTLELLKEFNFPITEKKAK